MFVLTWGRNYRYEGYQEEIVGRYGDLNTAVHQGIRFFNTREFQNKLIVPTGGVDYINYAKVSLYIENTELKGIKFYFWLVKDNLYGKDLYDKVNGWIIDVNTGRIIDMRRENIITIKKSVRIEDHILEVGDRICIVSQKKSSIKVGRKNKMRESRPEIVNPNDKDFWDNVYNFYTVFQDEYIVYANNLQEAIDYLADYVEEKGYSGYIGSEEEKYIVAGNHGIYLHTDIMARVKENGRFI